MIVEKKGVDYDAYVNQQGRKANNPNKRELFIETRHQRIRKFTRIFTKAKEFLNPGKVLCLGARTGCEIIGARKAGFPESEGIDLHPVGNVAKEGDWHNIPFKNNSFQNVFTNSIDHCFDIQKLAWEVRRVLQTKGRFLFMLSGTQMLNTKEDRADYMLHSQNFLFWEDGLDLVAEIEKYGFRLMADWQMGNRWHNYVVEKL